MASDYGSFWQTLVAESSKVSDTLTGTNAVLKAAWKDIKPQQAALGETINIVIPANVDSEVTDAPYADKTFNEFNNTVVPVVMNKKPGHDTIIRSFEQYNSPKTIKDVILTPSIQAVARKANGYLAGALITSNFTQTTAVSTTLSKVTTTQFLSGQEQLINNFVNVQDPANMTYIQAVPVWKNQLDDAAWTAEATVGINQAQDAKRDGALKVCYGASVAYDQAMPRTGTAGSYVYTSVLMSRVALVAAFRPLPPGGPATETTYIMVDGIPLRIMLSFSHEKDGWLLSVDAGMGLAVARPEQGVLFTTAQGS